MLAARIGEAAGLVAATTTDATNTYVVLTARSLNPGLKIIARASEEDAEKHMRTAGADQVVSPYSFAGFRIAQAFLRPHVINFLEVALLRSSELGIGTGGADDRVLPRSMLARDCAPPEFAMISGSRFWQSNARARR